MGEEERFDAIVIGAGPAGCACALVLARAGRSVLLVERGASAGSKNVTGGRVYTWALERLEAGLHAAAPLERKVVREQITVMSGGGATTVDYFEPSFDGEVPHSYTVLRAGFDEWLAARAESAGAMLAAGIRVDSLVEEGGRIIGVQAGEDRILAEVVIAADGVNSLIAQKAGLRSELTPHSVAVGVKELIRLDAAAIEARFQVGTGQGAARLFVGCTEGIQGGGFLYTNKDSISLGLVFSPEEAARHGRKVQEIVQDFKLHPAVRPLIEGGETAEYSAHLIPEAGWRGVPAKLYREGLIVTGDAAGFAINGGFVVRGIDLAIASGIAAAQAVLSSKDAGAAGPSYMAELEKIGLIGTMKRFSGFPELLANPRMFNEYPALQRAILKGTFTVDGKAPDKITDVVRRAIGNHGGMSRLLADAWKGWRSL